MNTLYIIGNGFDLAHNLPTSYWNFRQFLEMCDWEFLRDFEQLYGIPQVDEQDPYTNVTAWRNRIYDILWGSLEENMSHVDVDDILDMSDSIIGQLDLDGGNIGIEDTMNEYWRSMFGFIRRLPQYVQEWIESIDLSQVIPRKRSLIGLSEAKFLTFNYTATLEECYGIDSDSIVHIHGALSPYSDVEPIMGHGFQDGIDEHRQEAYEADERFDEGRKSIENAIADIFETTFKDTASIIRENSYYFRNLCSIDHVIVIGLSYCDVDLPYLAIVKRYVSPDARWTMHFHTESDMRRLAKVIDSLSLDSTSVECKKTDDFWNN